MIACGYNIWPVAMAWVGGITVWFMTLWFYVRENR